jgi:hypothetical protein
MADSTLIKHCGQWVFHQGVVAGGAYLYVYDAGTETLASIYSDDDLTVAANNPVIADANGLMPFAYRGTTAYKIVLKTQGGTTIDTEDNIPGALDTSSLTTTYAKPDTDVSAKTADYTVLVGDLGTILAVDTTGGSVTITLISAITATNGKGLSVIHTGSANQVNIATVSAQTIMRQSGATTTMALKSRGQCVTLKSDGANWIQESGDGLSMDKDTAMLFVQTAAPTGWTKSTTHNDKALRVVSGTASTGGSTAFSTVFAGRTIAQGNLPSYTLPNTLGVSIANGSTLLQNSTTTTVGTDNFAVPNTRIGGTNVTVTGSITGSVTSGGSGTAMDFAVNYVDCVIATVS